MGYTILVRDREDSVWERGDIFKIQPRKWDLPLPQKTVKIKVWFGDIREIKNKLNQSVFGKHRRRYKIDIDNIKFKNGKAFMWSLKNLIDKEAVDASNN